MTVPKWVPTGAEVAREALIVLAGAIAAAAIVGAFPALRDWIKQQWNDAPH
jgi:Flp pilus assembly pilin Flp